MKKISKQSDDTPPTVSVLIKHGDDGELRHRYQADSSDQLLTGSGILSIFTRRVNAAHKCQRDDPAQSLKERRKTSVVQRFIRHGRVGGLRHHQHEGISDQMLSDNLNWARSARIASMVSECQDDMSAESVKGWPEASCSTNLYDLWQRR